MSYLPIAREVLADTKKLLKGTLKATNKSYWTRGEMTNRNIYGTLKYFGRQDLGMIEYGTMRKEEMERAHDYAMKSKKGYATQILKWNEKNNRTLKARDAVDAQHQGNQALQEAMGQGELGKALLLASEQPRGNKLSGKTILAAGKRLYMEALTEPETWWGNCGEQALVAIALSEEKGVSPKHIWLVDFRGSGTFTHSAVLLCDERQISLKFGAFCDPWMSIACSQADYPKEAKAKLKEWTSKGKRLLESGVGWELPDSILFDRFWENCTSVRRCLDTPTIGGGR
jgi:hypothetical protein